MFWFPSAYQNYVYTVLQSIKCAIALYPKCNVHTLLKKYFIAKKWSPSPELQQVVIFLLVDGPPLVLMAAD